MFLFCFSAPPEHASADFLDEQTALVGSPAEHAAVLLGSAQEVGNRFPYLAVGNVFVCLREEREGGRVPS